MKRYVFEVVIYEGSDEFWEEITDQNSTGCDEVKDLVYESFRNHGLEPDIKLVAYTDSE